MEIILFEFVMMSDDIDMNVIHCMGFVYLISLIILLIFDYIVTHSLFYYYYLCYLYYYIYSIIIYLYLYLYLSVMCFYLIYRNYMIVILYYCSHRFY